MATETIPEGAVKIEIALLMCGTGEYAAVQVSADGADESFRGLTDLVSDKGYKSGTSRHIVTACIVPPRVQEVEGSVE